MIIGVTGHIDHGKTSLVGRLTGVDTDRLKEEKLRGISIDIGFAYWQRPSGKIVGFVDVPGHEALIHNMLAGATGIDYVILVVAADDGVMPQTREHLAILDLLGLQRGVVALNKCDATPPERLAEVTDEITQTLIGTGLEGAAIVPVSAVTGSGLDNLIAHIDAAGDATKIVEKGDCFRLAVDRCFTLPGLGTTVTGTVLSGQVRVDDRVIVSPSGLPARIRSIRAHNQTVDEGRAGQRCALVLSGPGIAKETVTRGDMVLDPVLHAPTSRIDARVRILDGEPKPIGQWFPVKLHHAAAEVSGRVVVLRDTDLLAGQTDFIQLVLDRPIAATVGDRFVIRDTSSSRTIGGGSFVDLRGWERRRRTPQRRQVLEALACADPFTALARALGSPPGWIDFDGFARDRALSDKTKGELVADLELAILQVGGNASALSGNNWKQLCDRVSERLTAFHASQPDLASIGLEQLRREIAPQLPAALFLAAMRRMAEAGVIALDRMWVRKPEHQVRLSPDDDAIWNAIRPLLADEPYRPPRVRDIARSKNIDEALVRRLLRMAVRRGDADEIAHDHYFLRHVVQRMAEIAIEVSATSPQGRFTAADFRNRLDNGRKVAIQILEFFDRHGLTMRRQDLRRINPARIEMFTPQLADIRERQTIGGVPLPVGRPDFKSGWGRQTVPGGFDSHPPPPPPSEVNQ